MKQRKILTEDIFNSNGNSKVENVITESIQETNTDDEKITSEENIGDEIENNINDEIIENEIINNVSNDNKKINEVKPEPINIKKIKKIHNRGFNDDKYYK